ncbi:uncharacterized protein PV09_02272 [Verruconis gallopava]|uniref:Peptidase M16 N-terminal domain-containing protein n=1 Tax=Verruconis gallopava TaxID=253628 RepID=A0A0D1Z3B5_9PEZI|nr:uncharacterized protein PV09_02272 [Verruconis gallopava]KIW07432.1 hypothetical protein PV09_02272 [Verruconis gallopava]
MITRRGLRAGCGRDRDIIGRLGYSTKHTVKFGRLENLCSRVVQTLDFPPRASKRRLFNPTWRSRQSSEAVTPASSASTSRLLRYHTNLLTRSTFTTTGRISRSDIDMSGSSEPLNSLGMPVERVADTMEKPLLDNRAYRVIRLQNQLEALLIHDPDTDKASASLDVNVGSFSDADDMPGMAHAVEHLLFMGTEKYPAENAYNQYLTAHSGYSNAYTASTSTNYYFEVAASNSPSPSRTSSQINLSSQPTSKTDSPLYGALDRFAQFFIKPLFLEDTVDRELRAVDSENKKNLQSDTWRLHQLNKSLSNPKHPYCHFSTGNYKTLHDEPLARGVKIRDEFIKFYEKHYSANRMKLVVLGRESLNELEHWVEELFSDVKNKDLPQNRWDNVQPLTEQELGMQIFAKPVFHMRTLDLYFPYPDEEMLYDSQPGRYLSHLIGHEGPGSILAFIKGRGWANGLGAGVSPLCPGSAFFSISIRLTEDGLKHYEEVVETVFQYISVLKDKPPQEWIFEEMKQMSEVNFKFRQKSPASKTTSALANVMQRPLPRDHLLSGLSLLRKFHPQGILRGLSHLRPENFRLMLVSQEFPGDWDQKEKWYGTEYKCVKMSDDLMNRLRKAASASPGNRPPGLHLPVRNEFIPSRLEVERKDVSEPAKVPKLIRNDDRVRTWYKKDDQFWVPKANLKLLLRSPLVITTPRSAGLTQLYQALVKDALVEYAYAAEIAGLEYEVTSTSSGLHITLSGYNDKMAVLLEKVLVQMRDLEVNPERFRIVKERLIRGHKNAELQQPYHQVGVYTRWLTIEQVWITEQLLAELPDIAEEDVRAFFPQILRQLHIEVLAHGNLYREDALRFTEVVENTLRPRKLPLDQWPVKRSMIFPPGCNYIYKRELKDPANVNHCIEYLLYVGNSQDRHLRAKVLLLGQIADEPCFDQLRTKEQLGYVVFSGATVHNTWLGYHVLVQSERTPEYLETRIESFLNGLGNIIRKMPDDKFEKLKNSLINKRLERLKNLSSECNRFSTHILNEGYDFEQADHDAAHLEPLTKEDIIKFFERFICPNSERRAKLSVHLLAQNTASSIIENISSEEDKNTILTKALSKIFAAHNISTDSEKLATRLRGRRLSLSDSAPISEAAATYLTMDASLPADKAREIVQQGLVALGGSIERKGENYKATTSRAPVIIEDVHAWKAGLKVDVAAQPVRPLSDFEDIEPKL